METSNQSIGDYLMETFKSHVTKYGDTQWMHDVSTGKTMTYSEMVDSVTRLASALRKRGLKVGDSVLMMATNSIEIALSIFSVMKAEGATATAEELINYTN